MEFRDLKAQYQRLKPEIDQAIGRVLQHGQYILGSEVTQLEAELADYVGVKHCVTCGNGTDALQLALMAWGIGAGDAVFVADFTFFASAEVIAAVGAVPVFVDIDPVTFNMDATSLEQAIIRVQSEGKLRPKAVIAVDLFGQPADYTKIRPVCSRYDLQLLEDGAQGFGGAIGDQKVCSFGDMGTTSFFPAKPLGCYGDGGAVFTNDDEMDDLLRSLKFHGKGEDKYDNVRIGMNSRLDTIQAAILLVKFKAFRDYELNAVNEVAKGYSVRLRSLVKIPQIMPHASSSWAQYCIILDHYTVREGLRKHLAQQGIPTMIYFPKPMHAQKAFQYLEDDGSFCPIAADISRKVLALPMGPYLKEEDLEKVCNAVTEYISNR